MAKHIDEVGAKAAGGTELQRDYLYSHVDNKLLDEFQIVISRCRELEQKPRLFWVKDLHTDPEVQNLQNPNFLNHFEYIVHNSDWQRIMYQAYLRVPWEKQHVLKNAIIPSNVDLLSKCRPEKVKIIYSSTPQRGLNILYSVFDELYKDDKSIELNVYSSFDIYGHHSRNIPFLPLFEKCKEHPGINYYGSVTHDEVLEAQKSNHILALPSIWEETSCITVMENMSAGNLIVTNNLGALSETTAGFSLMYDYTENINTHASRFYDALTNGINLIRKGGKLHNIPVGFEKYNLLSEQKQYADHFYNWELRGKEWTEFLTKILNK